MQLVTLFAARLLCGAFEWYIKAIQPRVMAAYDYCYEVVHRDEIDKVPV